MSGSSMERMRSSSWVEEHKLSTIGAVWATAVGAYAYSRRRRATTSPRLLTHAVLGLGGAALALAHHYYDSGSKKQEDLDLDLGFYSQLPPATDADGNENERWSW